MTEKTLDICDPCRDGTHMECVGDDKRQCECLVCAGERIGDAVIGQPNDPPHGRIVDRLDPRPWRP